MGLSDEQVNDLARPLVGIVISFYEDLENERRYQEWLLNVEKQRKSTESTDAR